MATLEPDNNEPVVPLYIPTGLSLEKSLSYRSRCDEIESVATNTSLSVYKRLEILTTIAKNAVGLYIAQQQVAIDMAKQEFGSVNLDGMG